MLQSDLRLLEDWAAWLRAAGRAGSTIKLRLSQINRLADSFAGRSLLSLSAAELVEFLGAHEWAGDTLRSHRAALRGFYSWAVGAGLIGADPAAGLPSARSRVGVPRPAGDDVIQAALARADDRDALMIRLGAYAGLRACEIATLHSDRIFEDLDGWSVEVLGKGRRRRMVPLNRRLALELRSRPAGWVFPGRIDGHLSAAYVTKRLSLVLGEGVTGHQLRHRFASAAYRADRDIRAVQELLGHSSPATTAIYTAVPDEAKRRAVEAAAG